MGALLEPVSVGMGAAQDGQKLLPEGAGCEHLLHFTVITVMDAEYSPVCGVQVRGKIVAESGVVRKIMQIYSVVRQIPRGRVATYGQIARLAGMPGHARQVGYALNALPDGLDIPWHRVINAGGGISTRFNPLDEDIQRGLLEEEGVEFNLSRRLSLARYRWQPVPWSVYIVRSRRGTLYTGITTDVERRLSQHQEGKGAKALRGKGPLILVFEREIGTRGLAQRVEASIKKLSRAEKERLIRNGYPDR